MQDWLGQKIECGKADFYSRYRLVTLEISSRSPKSTHLFFVSQWDNIIKFSQSPSFPSRDNLQESYLGQDLTFQSAVVTLKVR